MQKQFGKDTEEFKFFMEYWQLVQKYAEPEEGDEFWLGAIHDFGALCGKYGDKMFFVRKLCISYMTALSDRKKELFSHEKE